MRIAFLACIPVCLLSLFLVQKSDNNQSAAAENPTLVQSATQFLSTLSAEQKGKAVLEYGAQDRVKWHFIPMETRKGLPVMEMGAPQKDAAFALLKTAVSELGYSRSRAIMNNENLLLKLEGPASAARRNPEKYYFALYGEPSATGVWGLSIEGHHMSLNFVIDNGKIVDSTPQVFATNPAELKADYGDGFPKGMKIIKDEESLAFALVKSLNETQKKSAIFAEKALAEVRWAGEAQPHLDPAQGISFADLTADQQSQLKGLIQAYTKPMVPAVADDRLNLIEKAGYDKIKFGWAGALEPGIGHYYSIQGPSFLIEFVNTQPDAAGNPANHIHCIWRDMTGDFNLPVAAK